MPWWRFILAGLILACADASVGTGPGEIRFVTTQLTTKENEGQATVVLRRNGSEGTARAHLARMETDGSLDHSFNTFLDGFVTCVGVDRF